LTVRSNENIYNGHLNSSEGIAAVNHASGDTKQRLVETAVDLIWQSSYGSVSVDDICKAAGVGKGSFYHYFPSKADLAVAAMDRHFENMRPHMDAIFSFDLPPLKRFEALADFIVSRQESVLEKYGRVCGCPFAALGSEMAGHEESIRVKTDEIFRFHQNYCESALREAIDLGVLHEDTDAGMVAEDIRSYILGQMMVARIRNSLAGLHNLKQGLLRIISAKAGFPPDPPQLPQVASGEKAIP
jgi:TetR/AcrR family transcriptional regulator, transcriptional repressor for nem operon